MRCGLFHWKVGENKKPREEGVDTSEPEFQIVLASVVVKMELLRHEVIYYRYRQISFTP
jgi:hypothetical protein